MPIEGTINSLYLDYEQTKPLFPRTKTKAVSDENGVGLDATLSRIQKDLSNKATEAFVTNKIAEAQLGGGSGSGDIDLSGFATRDDIAASANTTLDSAKTYTNDKIATIDFPVDSVNGKTGAITLSAADVSAVPTARTVNGKKLSSNITLSASDVGAAAASSVGTNKVFNKLTDIGITTFPTTMKTVVNSMPANSTLMLDSRDIIAGGTHEISDLGINNAGMYMFMRGDSNARVTMLHIYGSTSATTSYMNFGCYAATSDKTTWILGERQNRTYPDCRYRIAADGETEWINPPMLAGTEYRTTERWNGKVVYVKLLTWKNTADINYTTTVSIPHGITNIMSASARIDYTTDRWGLPYISVGTEKLLTIDQITSKNIILSNELNLVWEAGRTWYFYMKYCKTS